jgi:H/ACA ribonucleoprotein complex subunit 3
MDKIFKCEKCGEYTLEKTCSKCCLKTISPKPAKFSLEDKYGVWRRIYKNELESKGIKEGR